MAPAAVTVVDAVVPEEKAADLVAGFEALSRGSKPDGLVRSELLRGQGQMWRIVKTWRDLDALRALRASGEPPGALQLLDRLGLERTHAVFTVEQTFGE